jgi:DNA-binding GntR family transcriptional regulator
MRAIEKHDLEEVTQAIRNHMEQVKKDVLRYAFKETGFEGSRGQGIE